MSRNETYIETNHVMTSLVLDLSLKCILCFCDEQITNEHVHVSEVRTEGSEIDAIKFKVPT